tara:strand:- start:2986 stop:3177 length:192 start_codon:yes stop_codon:yes gene_type:complete
MESLRKLLRLEVIGWVLIALAAFNFSDIAFKWGVLCILICKICCALNLGCKWCSGDKTDCKVK